MIGKAYMNTLDLTTLEPENLNKIVSSIPFYKAVKNQSEDQYQELLRYSRILQCQSGEKILTRGQTDHWSYFLVKGQLVVTVLDEFGRQLHIHYITPGEVFGDLSVLLKTPRTADVYVDENSREALIFGTDFSLFGQLLNFNIASLETKLVYYRHTVQTLRWKLEMFRSKYPGDALANQHRQIKLYNGEKNTVSELQALYLQSTQFAQLLLKWNNAFGKLSLVEGDVPPPNILKK